MLPEGWKIFRGEEIAQKITKGQSPKWQGFEYQKDGAIFITSENVRDGFLDISRPKFLPVEFSNKIKGSQLKKGDVLINLVGASIGRSCLYKKNFPHANINQAVCTFRTNSYADPHFLALFFQYPKTIDRLICGQNASARPNISLGDIKNFEVLLPPLPEQKKIAAILSTWDRAIEGTEKLLANSQQQKKALMQQLLTGKKRLPGFTGEWKQHRLSDCCHIVMGSSPKSEFYNETGKGLPLLQGNADIKNRFSYPRIFTSEITKECNVGDILLSVRAPVGTVSIAVHHACIGRGISSIRVKKGNSQEFAYQYFLSIEDRWDRLAQGSTFEAVNGDDIKKLTIQLPSLPEQKAIAAVLSTADEEITAIESDLSRLRQEKKALMQQLLTGKRRVKVD